MLIPVTRAPSVISRTFIQCLAPAVTSLRLMWTGSGTERESRENSSYRRFADPKIFSLSGMKNTDRMVGSTAVHYLIRSNIANMAGIQELLAYSGYVKPNPSEKNPRDLEEDDEPCMLFCKPDEGFTVLDEQSRNESMHRSTTITIITPICMQSMYDMASDEHSLVLSEFGRLFLLHARNGYVFNPATSRLINGNKITNLLRLGAKLEKIKLMTSKAYLYHPKSNQYIKKGDAAILQQKGEVLTEPDDFYWSLSWSKGKAK